MEVLIVVVRLKVIKLRVKRLEKVVIGVERPRKVAIEIRGPRETAIAEIKESVSLLLPTFLLLATSLLLSAFWFLGKLFLTFDKCFYHIFSFFSLLLFFQRSSVLSLLSLALVITSSIFLCHSSLNCVRLHKVTLLSHYRR